MKIHRPLAAIVLGLSSFFTVLAQNAEEASEYAGGKAAFVRAAKAEQRRLQAASSNLVGTPSAPQVANAADYQFATTTNGSLTDMSTGTTQLVASNTDDAASALTSIGFNFYFQGVRYTAFSVNSNGVIRLGAAAQGSTPYKPLAQASIPIITAYGADQRTHTSGKVHFKLTGAAPNRTLVVEWLNMQSNFGIGTADLTYQVRLNETTGVIEFVYGSMTMSAAGAADTNSNNPNIGFSSSNTAGTVGSVTAPQSGTPAPTFDGASATAVTNLYTAGAISVLSSNADGSRRTFTFSPVAPIAPTAAAATNVTARSQQLNWIDNSTNEELFVIERSTDGVNFSFLTTVAANATSFNETLLTPATTYFYKVYAVSEGAVSSPASITAPTNPAGNDTCAGAGGNWSSPATWADGSVPTDGDNVVIPSGCTVTIDTAAPMYNLTVQSGGVVQFETTIARTATVGGTLSVNSGGIVKTQNAGTVTTHVLNVQGDLINDGGIDFSSNANTAGATITLSGGSDSLLTPGAASSMNLRIGGVAVAKANSALTVTFTPGGSFLVQGANAAGFLSIGTGTFKLDGTKEFSNPVFATAAYTIPATGGFWLNNPNAMVTGQNGSPTVAGSLRVSAGTLNIGTTSGNSMGFAAGSNIKVEGGTINAAGRFGVSAATNPFTYSQSGGTITVCTVGNASTTLASFDMGTSLSSSVAISGGIIVVQLAATGASGPRDVRQQAASLAAITGGTLQMGNAASGAAKSYTIGGILPKLVIDNTSAGHTVTMNTTLVNFNNLTDNLTITPGTTFNAGNVIYLFNGTSLVNNGTLTSNGVSSNFVFFRTNSPVTVTGNGTFTAPTTAMSFQSDFGTTFQNANNWVTNALRVFSGNINGASKLVVGNGGTTTAVMQFGNATTATASGALDSAPTFNPGSGGTNISYLRSTTSRTTGFEIPPSRTITNLTYDDNDPTHSLSISGGDLVVSGALTLTNGPVRTAAGSTLVHNGTVTRTNGFVEGSIGRTFAAPGSYIFPTGNGGYTPVTANVTAAAPVSGNVVAAPTSPSLTVQVFPTFMPGVNAPTSASRYWLVESNGSITADLTFAYLATDVNGNEADYRVYKRSGPTLTNMCPAGPCVNTAAHTVSVTGVNSFSLWTAAQPFVPTAAPASLAGRVVTSSGAGIRNAIVTVTGGRLSGPVSMRTGALGAFRFENLPTGENYVVTVNSRRYRFEQTSRMVGLIDNVSDLDFVARP